MILPPKIWGLAIALGMAACVEGVMGSAVLANTETPVVITSQSMVAKNKEGKATFEGAVVFKQGDLVIHSDVMIVFFKKEKTTGQANAHSQREIDVIEAKGKVLIEKGEGESDVWTCYVL